MFLLVFPFDWTFWRKMRCLQLSRQGRYDWRSVNTCTTAHQYSVAHRYTFCSGLFLSPRAEHEDFIGIRFKEVADKTCSRIFNQVAKEFSDFRSAIVSLLIGLPQNKLYDEQAKTVAGCTERRLLLDGLSLWFSDSDQPTGRELYDALVDAGCPEELLTKYKKPLKVCCKFD